MSRKPVTAGNLALMGYEEIFNVSTGNTDGERVVQIPTADLYSPEFHPFIVQDDDAMSRCRFSF